MDPLSLNKFPNEFFASYSLIYFQKLSYGFQNPTHSLQTFPIFCQLHVDFSKNINIAVWPLNILYDGTLVLETWFWASYYVWDEHWGSTRRFCLGHEIVYLVVLKYLEPAFDYKNLSGSTILGSTRRFFDIKNWYYEHDNLSEVIIENLYVDCDKNLIPWSYNGTRQMSTLPRNWNCIFGSFPCITNSVMYQHLKTKNGSIEINKLIIPKCWIHHLCNSVRQSIINRTFISFQDENCKCNRLLYEIFMSNITKQFLIHYRVSVTYEPQKILFQFRDEVKIFGKNYP